MGWIDAIVSIATGGLSDVVQGNAPGTGFVEEVTNEELGNLYDSILKSVATGGMSDVYYAVKGGGSLFDIVDRAIDPGGSVDYLLDQGSKVMPDQLRPYLPAIGATIGNFTYGPLMAAAGYGAGAKLAGSQDNKANAQGALMAMLAAYGMDGIKGMFSVPSTTPTEVPGVDPYADPYSYQPQIDAPGYGYVDQFADPYSYAPEVDAPPTSLNEAPYFTEETPYEDVFDLETGEALPKEQPFDWERYLKEANKLFGKVGTTTGNQTFGTITAQLPGTATSGDMLGEMLARAPGKRGRITSDLAQAPDYGATFVNQKEIEKYNPQQLYYT